MEKTAVEFLEQELDKNFEIRGNSFLFDKILKQAKEMEEDEAHKAYLYGHEVGFMKAKEHELNKSE